MKLPQGLYRSFGKAKKNSVVLMASGGLDSSILLAEAASRGKRVYPLFIHAGLRFQASQLKALKRFIRALNRKNIAPVTEVSLPANPLFPAAHWALSGKKIPAFQSPDGSCYLPGWNLLILAPAMTFAAQHGIGEIQLGHVAHNPYPDGQSSFFRALEKTGMAAFGRRIRIERPYGRLHKNTVLRRGKKFPLALTLTCINPRGLQHCGRCHKCAERQRGFKLANIPDLTIYTVRSKRDEKRTVKP